MIGKKFVEKLSLGRLYLSGTSLMSHCAWQGKHVFQEQNHHRTSSMMATTIRLLWTSWKYLTCCLEGCSSKSRTKCTKCNVYWCLKKDTNSVINFHNSENVRILVSYTYILSSYIHLCILFLIKCSCNFVIERMFFYCHNCKYFFRETQRPNCHFSDTLPPPLK